MPSFELIRSEPILQGRAFKIRRDYLKTPDGHETKYDIVEHGGSVVIVPFDGDGNLLFVRQYRHAAGMPRARGEPVVSRCGSARRRPAG